MGPSPLAQMASGPKLSSKTIKCSGNEFDVAQKTAWHQAIKTAASKPGPTIGHSTLNCLFTIAVTMAY